MKKHLFKSKDGTIEFRANCTILKETNKFDDEEMDKTNESQLILRDGNLLWDFETLITRERIFFNHVIYLPYDATVSRTTINLDPTIRNKQVIYLDEFKLSYFFDAENILKVEVES